MPRKKKRREQGAEPRPTPELSGLARLLVEMPVETLDLHGMTADQAERRLLLFFQRHGETSRGQVVHVITGKGSGSEGAPVLPGLVREVLTYDVEKTVAEFGGLPGGGGFAVRIAGD
jgi:DNA-nicking Smr family endonuclease